MVLFQGGNIVNKKYLLTAVLSIMTFSSLSYAQELTFQQNESNDPAKVTALFGSFNDTVNKMRSTGSDDSVSASNPINRAAIDNTAVKKSSIQASLERVVDKFSSTNCTSENNGTLRYNNNIIQACQNGSWIAATSSGGSGGTVGVACESARVSHYKYGSLITGSAPIVFTSEIQNNPRKAYFYITMTSRYTECGTVGENAVFKCDVNTGKWGFYGEQSFGPRCGNAQAGGR